MGSSVAVQLGWRDDVAILVDLEQPSIDHLADHVVGTLVELSLLYLLVKSLLEVHDLLQSEVVLLVPVVISLFRLRDLNFGPSSL